MESANLEVTCFAHAAILQNVIRCWGLPPATLLANLTRTREALVASGMQQRMSDAALDTINALFEVMCSALGARIENLPDTRPDPLR